MGLSDTQKEMTPFINITTKAAFPEIDLPDDTSDVEANPVTEKPHPTEKVILSYCSELSDYTAPVTLFDAKHKLKIFHDSRAQPILFTAGTDERLYGLVYVANLREGWQAVDITPGESKERKIIAFDAIETEDTIYVAVAVRDKPAVGNILYHGKLDKPTLAGDKFVLKGLDAEALGWQIIANNLGSKDITTLTCTYSRFSESLNIAVGTSQSDAQKLSASHYLVNVSDLAAPWHHVPMPATAKQILGLSAGKLPNTKGDALFTFFEDNVKNRRIVASVITSDGKTSQEIDHIYRLLPGTIGDAQDFFVSPNPWECSDVVVAGTTGIGFYNFEAIDQVPQTVPELEGISFKQVVCTEYGTKESTSSTINILAVSKRGELYFVEGHRYYHDKSIKFECTGLPIQVDVGMVAARFNGLLDSSEVCYSSSSSGSIVKSNELFHLYSHRSATMSSWTSAKIAVLAEEKTTRIKAYLTTIKLRNEAGTPVPRGYPIRISASAAPVLATVNCRASCIGPQPIEIMTADAAGTVLIATPATDVLTAPTFTVSLPKYNTATKSSSSSSLPKYDLYTNQRVIWLLKNNAPTVEDLKNARDANGEPVFDPSSDFSAAASLMGSFKDMSLSIEEEDGGACDLQKSWTVDENGNLKEDDDDEKGWFKEVVDKTGKFLGDVVQFLKTAVKGVVKLGIFAAKGVVKLLIKVGGKPMEFFLTTLGELVTGVLSAVGHLLKSAFKGLLELFGLWPDEKFVQDTHEVLSGVVSAMLSTADMFIQANMSTLEMAADKLAEQARSVVKDTRPGKIQGTNQGRPSKDHPLMKILNNPIVEALLRFNPIAWIAEAIQEEVDIEGLDLPDFGPLISIFTKALPDLAVKQLENLALFFEDLSGKCGKFLKDKGKILDIFLEVVGSAFWTLFDGFKEIVFALYKIAGAVIGQLRILLEYRIKIPFLSKAFEDETGLPFTLVNLATYVMSFVLCLGQKTNPADKLRPVLNYMRSFKKENMDMKAVLGWTNTNENTITNEKITTNENNEDDSQESAQNDFQAQLQKQALAQRTGRLNFQDQKHPENPSYGLMSGGSDHNFLEHMSQMASSAIAFTRMFLILTEAVVPYNDAVYHQNMKDVQRRRDLGEILDDPDHDLPAGAEKRKSLHHFSLAFAGINVVGHIVSFVVTVNHPHADCKRISWSGASAALSGIALLLDVFKGSMKLSAAADALELKPAVISALSTAASICQIKSEDELSPTMEALHYTGCGAGALVVVGILLRKSQPEVAIALGGLFGFVDFGVTFITGWNDFLNPHHGSVHEAEEEGREETA